MDDEELLKGYEADQKFRNLLQGTLDVRRRNLRKFIREVGFHEATEQKIIIWLSRDISAKTRNGLLSHLNAFYKWAIQNDLLEYNPAEKISKPRMHPKHPRPMPENDICLAVDKATPKMKCWLLLGAYAGCRCQEIAGIEREDIFIETARLHIVHGKGDKERWVPLHPDILIALQELPMSVAGPLWNETPSSVSRKINNYLHGLGIKSTAHTLRHWFATNAYRSSKDLRLTQELMGHSSPQTTAVYAAADQSAASGVINGLTIGGK